MIGSVLAELRPDMVKVKTLKNLVQMITSELGLLRGETGDEKCEDAIPRLREAMEKESNVYRR